MSAAVHIICGPAGSGTTGRLLERYRTVNRSSLGAALWIVPSQRDVDALRPRLLDGPCLFAPNLLTFQDFAEEIIRVNDPAARPLSDVQRRLLADEVTADLHLRKQLTHFEGIIDTRGFAEGVFALLAELKRNEIWPAAFARAAYQRAYPGNRIHRSRRGRIVSLKDRQCIRIYAKYQQRLIRHQLYDVEGRYWYARDLLTRGLRRPFADVRAVFVAGFSSFTRTQYDILAELAGTVEEVWITLPDEPEDERAELFRCARATRDMLEASFRRTDWQSVRERLDGLPIRPTEIGITVEDTQAVTVEVLSRLAEKPAGLAHIDQQLFRPFRTVVKSADASGILLIEAPGMLGEARLVARQIKELLLARVPAADIVVSMRDVVPYADLLREVFAEYGIPCDVEGAEPLLRNPAVATLLRALRLPEDDWPFAGVTALLRSNYFRPDWPEAGGDATMPQHAEALLRLLGEPRSRDAYLKAVERWVLHPPQGLEDEEAEAPRRRRTHELAGRCRDFLHRFFQAWDDAPQRAPLREHIAWLRRLAADLGILRAAEENARDRTALRRFWEELEAWERLAAEMHEAQCRADARPVGRIGNPSGSLRTDYQSVLQKEFGLRLHALAMQAGLPRSPRGPGRVRILSAELARNLEVPHLFLMGLGERSFPDLSAPEPIFDEAERQAFRQAGLDFPGLEDRLPAEMLLFYQLVTRPSCRLVLSYPAVDEKGQALLPSSFLAALLACFEETAVTRMRRNMLIEGYDRAPPLSPAEYRVQAGARGVSTHLAPDLAANLRGAARLAQQRQDERSFTAYDGSLRHSAVLTELQKRCGPEKVFSPTSLEHYVACPFRFFLESVLRLEPLEEPREEIEQTRRGAAFHRALARLHQQLKTVGVEGPSEDVTAHLFTQLEGAIAEYIERAPSPASKVLWEIEGQRLRRSAERYLPHWQKFVGLWAEHRVLPRPHHFEASFGLPAGSEGPSAAPLVLRTDGVEVRIGGRIDRVDLAEIDGGFGFWIIDYKTGRGSHYSGSDLQQFKRLQLTLYALAVEEVLLAGRTARPLGLAYWLVTDTGPKCVMPGSGKQLTTWLHQPARWGQTREQLTQWVATLVNNIRQGNFPLRPGSDNCTETCDFGQVCRISQSRPAVEKKEWGLELPVLTDKGEE